MTVNEVYKRMMEAFVRAPIAVYSTGSDWIEENGIESIEQAGTQEEREQVVAIANVICFFAYCLDKLEGIEEEDPEKASEIAGIAFRLLYLQGILKVYFTTEKDESVGPDTRNAALEAFRRQELRLFNEAPTKGIRAVLRDNLLLLQDYSGKVLFVQEHIPKHV